MRLRFRPLIGAAVAASALIATTPTSAQSPEVERWFFGLDLQAMVMGYAGSTTRDRLTNAGLFVRTDYLERAGVTVGFNRTSLAFASGGGGSGGGGGGGGGSGGSGGGTGSSGGGSSGGGSTAGAAGSSGTGDVDQDNLFLSLRYTLTPDWLPGRLTLRVDGHDISNDDAIGISAVTAVEPRITYVNYAATFSADIGFARSDYDEATSSPAFEIEQWTPTLGFGLNEQRDWLQLRAYLIDVDDVAESLGADDSSAVELKWTHWLGDRGLLGLDNVRVSVLGGERLFAVDSDAGSVYNLSERQTGAVAVGGEWRPAERSRVLLLLGTELYESGVTGDSYRGNFIYLNYSHRGN